MARRVFMFIKCFCACICFMFLVWICLIACVFCVINTLSIAALTLTVVLEVGVSQGALDTVLWGRDQRGRGYGGRRRLLRPDWFGGRTGDRLVVRGGARWVVVWPRLLTCDRQVDGGVYPRCHGNSRARPLNTQTVTSVSSRDVRQQKMFYYLITSCLNGASSELLSFPTSMAPPGGQRSEVTAQTVYQH